MIHMGGSRDSVRETVRWRERQEDSQKSTVHILKNPLVVIVETWEPKRFGYKATHNVQIGL